MYIFYQPNKKDKNNEYGDCSVRAITKEMNKRWLEVFRQLTKIAEREQCMNDSVHCIDKYLRKRGYKYKSIYKENINVKQMSKKRKQAILKLANHIVAIQNGNYYDTWDSGDRKVYGYWERS